MFQKFVDMQTMKTNIYINYLKNKSDDVEKNVDNGL
jgi:hypothetical protein